MAATLKCDTIQNASSVTANLKLDENANATVAGTLAMGSSFIRNRIINGSMEIDQRNAFASQTITAAAALAYTVDRWYAYCTGANVTGQGITGTGNNQHVYRFTGATSNTLVGFGQRIEQSNSYDLSDTAVTISCAMSASTNTTITWYLYTPTTTADTFGTIASPTVTQVATGTFAVTSTLTSFTANITAAQMAGINKGLELRLVAASGLGSGVTWTIDNVQLEPGTIATPFERRLYGTELMLCQRYYQKIDAFITTGSTTTTVIAEVSLNPTMRTTPSVSATAAIKVSDNVGADFTQSSASVSLVNGTRATSSGANCSIPNFTGLTTYRPYQSVPNETGFIAFSAEL